MNPQFRDAFLQGFSSTFRQWTALELAVHNEWGGPQSAEKANELMNQVLALFDDPKTMYKDEIAMLIEDYCDEEFSMVCEDGSPEEIGELLIQMWRECSEGEFRLVSNVCGRERDRLASNPLEHSQGLDGGDVIEGPEDEENPDMDQLEPTEEVPAEPLVDEDGFERVTRGKKAKKNRGK